MRIIRVKLKYIFLIFFIISIGGILFFILHREENRPNILLITADALRPDHLSCYGYKRNTSPNIDKLAREGVLFTQAISQSSWSISLVSLMTSTYPSTHKVNKWGCILDKRIKTLAEILKGNGYLTACTGGGDFVDKDLPGLGRGFEYLFNSCEAGIVIDEVIAWLKKFGDKKFFIWIHFFAYPHAPYLPPPPYDKMFLDDRESEGKKIPIAKNSEELLGVIPQFVAIDNIKNVNFYISQYDGEIAYMDFHIGRLLEVLESLGLRKNTLIIFSSDHGESLGEHNFYFQHGEFLYDQLIRIPLIITGPDLPKGKVINHQVRQIDIVPTILSLLKVKAGVYLEGRNLLPLIFDRKFDFLYAFSEVKAKKSVRTTKWKLICDFDNDRCELYNLEKDPLETSNLIEVEKRQAELLKVKLKEWMDRPRPYIIPLRLQLNDEDKEKLKGLGYLQ